MPRPHSAPGGRPHRVTIRLSDAEKADLDARRGGVEVNQFIRARLFGDVAETAPEAPTEPPTVKHDWVDVKGVGRCAVCNVNIEDPDRTEVCTGIWSPDLTPSREAASRDLGDVF